MTFRPSEHEKIAVTASRQVYAEDAAPLLEALRLLGIEISKLSVLYNDGAPDYRAASGLLAETLAQTSNLVLKREIVRSLTEKWARPHAKQLVDEFIWAAQYPSYQWVVGSALEVVASKDVARQMIQLAQNPDYGRAREMVVLGLGKLRCSESEHALLGLLSDNDVSGHALSALRKRQCHVPRAMLDSFLTDERAWVRKHARHLLGRSNN